MNEREKLIELLCSAPLGFKSFDSQYYKSIISKIADYLLDNGVIVPPCKVGDTVYYINKRLHIALYLNTIYKAAVVRIVTTRLGTSLVIQIHNEHGCTEIPNIKDFGKIVFLTREEAEKALKERGRE